MRLLHAELTRCEIRVEVVDPGGQAFPTMRPSRARTPVSSTAGAQGRRDDTAAVALSVLPPYDVVASGLPFGVLLVHSCLRQAGIPSRVVRAVDAGVDIPAPIVRESMFSVLSSIEPVERARMTGEAAEGCREYVDAIVDRFVTGRERVIGFSVWQTNVDFTLEICKRIKRRRPEVIIVLGGPQALQEPELVMADEVDAVLLVADPRALVPLFRAFLGDGSEGTPPGAWVHRRHAAGGLSRSCPGGPAQPFRTHIDYADIVSLHRDDPVAKISVLLNFGCPYACGFCSARTLYPTVSWGSPALLAQEMAQIMELWETTLGRGPAGLELHLADAAVNANPRLLDALCRRLLSGTLPRTPTLGGHFLIDQRITPTRVRWLMEAGFRVLSVGLESGSPSVRKAMRKPGSMGAIRRACETIADVGERRAWLAFFVIVGWPDETEGDFDQTVAFLEWAAGLGIVTQVTAIPLLKVPGQSMAWRSPSLADRGVAWEDDSPSGDPAVRFRRLVSLRQRLGQSVEIPFPLDVLEGIMKGR